jgi:hypothetical protein
LNQPFGDCHPKISASNDSDFIDHSLIIVI